MSEQHCALTITGDQFTTTNLYLKCSFITIANILSKSDHHEQIRRRQMVSVSSLSSPVYSFTSLPLDLQPLNNNANLSISHLAKNKAT